MATTPNSPATPRDDFVAKLVQDPRQPPDTLLLTGYVGRSSDEGHTRLYFDAQLSSYVEIPQDAILLTQDKADPDGLGGSYVWIKRDAPLIHGPIGPNRRKAAFLEGSVIQNAAAAGPLIPPPTAPVACSLAIAICPTLLPAQCHPTTPAAGCPVHTTPAAGCPVHTTPAAGCPVPTTPQAGCPVPTTPAAHCPIPTTPAAHCPPHTIPFQVCHNPSILALVCQTQFAHCPTNILPCPHPQLAAADAARLVQPSPFPTQLLCPHTLVPPLCPPLTAFPTCPPPPTHLLCPPTNVHVLCPIHTHQAICQIHTLPVICQPVSGAAICQVNSLACPSGAVCGPQIPGMPGVNPV